MSCITELIKSHLGRVVGQIMIEGGGEYRGYEYLVTFTHLGTRCGYVALPPGHKLNSCVDYDDIPVHCHGGITFYSHDHGLKSLLSQPCIDKWIGFDCAHCYDGHDWEKVAEVFGEKAALSREYLSAMDDFPEVTRKSYDFVVKECQSIIDQLIEKGG